MGCLKTEVIIILLLLLSGVFCAAADQNRLWACVQSRNRNFISQTYMEVHKHRLASVLQQSANKKKQSSIWCFHIYVEFKGGAAA